MNYLFALVLLISHLQVMTMAQIFEDGFSDSSFETGVPWWGDTKQFQHEKKEGIPLIQSQGDERSEIRIWSKIVSGISSEDQSFWEGYFFIDGAAPSRQNQMKIMLSIHPSESADSMANPDSLFHQQRWNGYGLMIGETGDDYLHLVRWDSSSHQILGTHPLLLRKSTGYHFRVVTNAHGLWNLRVDEGYPTTLDYLQTPGVELFDERYPIFGDHHYVGLFITHSSTRGHDFFFDFKLDPLLPPPTPLSIIHTRFTSPKLLELQFNKPIRLNQNVDQPFHLRSRYDDRAYTSKNVQQSSAHHIIIEWDEAVAYHSYELWHPILISTQNDTLLNETPHPVTLAHEPIPDSVHITEFLANPSAESGWPEYIEIYNASAKTIDITHSLLGDSKDLVAIDSVPSLELYSTEYTMLRPHTIGPKSYAVFTRTPEELQLLFPERNIVPFNLPYLNNGADELRWQSQPKMTQGELVIYDYISYQSDWTDPERSIERIRLDLDSMDPRNWGPSRGEWVDEVGPNHLPGTPGAENSVLSDTIGPRIQRLEITHALELEIYFTEPIHIESLELEFRDLTSYRLLDHSPTYSLTNEPMGSQIVIELMEELTPEQRILCKVIHAQDWFKNTQTQQLITKTYWPNDIPAPGDVVINELLVQPNNKWPYEYIELYNRSSKYLQLQHWSIQDQSGNTWRIPDDHILVPNSYMVFNSLDSSIPSLNNSEDIVIIQSMDGQTIDSLHYSKEWLHFDPHFAHSWDSSYALERINVFRSTNDPSNWKFSSSSEWGSPETINSVIELESPELTLSYAKLFKLNDLWYVETYFSSYIPEQALTELYLESEQGRYSLLLGGDELRKLRPKLFPHQHFLWEIDAWELVESDLRTHEWVVTINQNIRDELGKNHRLPSQQVCMNPRFESLRFNEVMFDPLQDPMDNQPNGVEYLEIWNQENISICLENLFIELPANEDGERASQDFHSTRFKWVPSNKPSLLVAYPDYIPFDQHPILEKHPIANWDDSHILMVRGGQFGLNKRFDKRYLSHRQLGILDSLYYSEEWHNPNLYSTKGWSLERIDLYPSYTSAQNWTSSIDPSGGTPLARNSVQQIAKSNGQTFTHTFYFEPNPFSPDHDGFEDVTFLHYSWDYSNYLIRVWIYDRHGRLVNKLLQSAAGGTQGAIMWNGKDRNGQRVPIGRYIAYLEASDAHNGKVKRLKTTVVVAR